MAVYIKGYESIGMLVELARWQGTMLHQHLSVETSVHCVKMTCTRLPWHSAEGVASAILTKAGSRSIAEEVPLILHRLRAATNRYTGSVS
jgi:hypothetical protein